jgi:hypothetical protein
MNVRGFDDPTSRLLRTFPLDLVDDIATLRKAKLVIAPIPVTAGGCGSVEAVADDARINELDNTVVVWAKEPDANRGESRLAALA